MLRLRNRLCYMYVSIYLARRRGSTKSRVLVVLVIYFRFYTLTGVVQKLRTIIFRPTVIGSFDGLIKANISSSPSLLVKDASLSISVTNTKKVKQ